MTAMKNVMPVLSCNSSNKDKQSCSETFLFFFSCNPLVQNLCRLSFTNSHDFLMAITELTLLSSIVYFSKILVLHSSHFLGSSLHEVYLTRKLKTPEHTLNKIYAMSLVPLFTFFFLFKLHYKMKWLSMTSGTNQKCLLFQVWKNTLKFNVFKFIFSDLCKLCFHQWLCFAWRAD